MKEATSSIHKTQDLKNKIETISREERQKQARSAMIASLDAELDDWKTLICTALHAAVVRRTAANTAFEEEIADMHASHDARTRKQSRASGFGERYHGWVR